MLRRPREFAFFSYLWQVWSPTWADRQAAVDAVAGSLDGPDLPAVVLSSYRQGRAETITDPTHQALDEQLAAGPRIDVPTTILLGADDGVETPWQDDPRDGRFFSHLLARRILPGVGHFPHREAAGDVAAAVRAGATSPGTTT